MSDLTDNEIRDEYTANLYEDWLSQQGDCYILNRLIGEIGAQPLEEHEIKHIVQMIQERNRTGIGDPRFEDAY